jgi:subtilisin family serine protease
MRIPPGLRTLVLLLSLAFVFFCTSASAEEKASRPTPRYAPGELIIRYKDDRDFDTARRQSPIPGLESIRRHRKFMIDHARLPETVSVEAAIRILKSDPNVLYAEPNYVRRTFVVPSDPFFPTQWALENVGQSVNGFRGTSGADISAVGGWDREQGDGSVVVALIDTGVDWQHPDLSANIWLNTGEIPGNDIDDDGNGFIDDVRGWDFLSGDNDPMDSNGHGTHVAATLGAETDNEIGCAGVAWNVKLMPLRFLGSNGVGFVSDSLRAINYAVRNGARIINASYGSSDYSQAEFDMIASAQSAGVLFVTAAGNEGSNNDTNPQYPASYRTSLLPNDRTVLTNIISVAASDQNDALAWFSNYGASLVDVAAPGVRIHNAMPKRSSVLSIGFENGDTTGWTLQEPWGLVSNSGDSDTFSISNSPAGNYANNSTSSATSPLLPVNGKRGLSLTFRIKGSAESKFDYLYLDLFKNGQWVLVPILVNGQTDWGVTGNFATWTTVSTDIGGVDGSQNVRFRFRFVSDHSNTATGYMVDNVNIFSSDPYEGGDETYDYMSGTSMATPHVSGLAALLFSQDSSRTFTDVKGLILANVDQIPALTGKIASGGRINMDKTLAGMFPPLVGPPSENGPGDPAPELEGQITRQVASGGGGGGCVAGTSSSAGVEWLCLALVLAALRLKSGRRQRSI